MSAAEEWTGGCLCGRVRYRATTAPQHATYCHCRMCQKAFGNLFGIFVSFERDRFAWTGDDEPKTYRSSDFATRGFCGHCGTPLLFAYDKYPDHVGIALGSLDRPDLVRPERHWGVESMVPWLKIDDGLPRGRTEDDPAHAVASGS